MNKPIRKTQLINRLFPLLILFGVSALAYLPLVGKFGYTHDDWYLMYAARVKGPLVFLHIFSSDRPLRALVMIPAYMIFGDNVLFYNLSAYFFRFLSGIGFFWILELLWSKQRRTNLSIAILFLLYPGFLSLTNGLDYQSHLIALAFAMLSIALNVKAFSIEKKPQRNLLLLFSVLLGWFYLGQMEYYIGFEFFRLAIIFLLASRKNASLSLWGKFWQTFRSWWVVSVIPVFFLVWRLFFFRVERGATDIGSQLGKFLISPLSVGANWAIHFVHDVFNVIFLAWGVPLYQYAFWLSVRESLVGFAIAGLVVLLAWATLHFMQDENEVEQTKNLSVDWRIEAFWLGLASVFFGIFPITLVNRFVNFSDYSRYTIVASAGAVLLLGSVLYYLLKNYIQMIAILVLVFIAVLTHHANGVKMATDTQAWQEFWWQTSWRIPQMEPGTNLIVRYYAGAIKEDYFVWGPANQIYYPEESDEQFVQVPISASLLNKETILNLLTGAEPKYRDRRSIQSTQNFNKTLILVQPTAASCLRVIDGEQPEISLSDNSDLMQITAFSKADQILLDAPFHMPSETIFGPEPAHGWCYIYQKATLARQKGNWDQVAALLTEAREKGSAPQDPIEWLPFIQASAMLGDGQRVQEIASFLKDEPFILQQACESLRRMELTPEMRVLAEDNYCVGE